MLYFVECALAAYGYPMTRSSFAILVLSLVGVISSVSFVPKGSDVRILYGGLPFWCSWCTENMCCFFTQSEVVASIT